MRPLFFRIIEQPDPDVFDDRWIEIPAEPDRFCFNRAVWRANHVSRNDDECAAIRFDLQDGTWRMENRAPGRVVILDDGRNRYDLQNRMSVEIGPGHWRGTLTGAFSFELAHERPGEPVRSHTDVVDEFDPGSTEPRGPVLRAAEYLRRHRLKRLALAYLWRDRLGHTTDVAEDRSSAETGRAFGEASSTITGWREDLAAYVYGERGHQHAIRDFVVLHALLSGEDVAEADRHVDGLAERSPDRPVDRGEG